MSLFSKRKRGDPVELQKREEEELNPGPPLRTHAVRQELHPAAYHQQEAGGKALTGTATCAGACEGDPPEWQEVQASQHGPLHLRDGPGQDSGPCGPVDRSPLASKGFLLLSQLTPPSCKDLPFQRTIKSCIVSSEKKTL